MKRYSDTADGLFMSETTDGEYCKYADTGLDKDVHLGYAQKIEELNFKIAQLRIDLAESINEREMWIEQWTDLAYRDNDLPEPARGYKSEEAGELKLK